MEFTGAVEKKTQAFVLASRFSLYSDRKKSQFLFNIFK